MSATRDAQGTAAPLNPSPHSSSSRNLDPDAVATPPLFMAFNLLYHDRRDLTGRPLRDRRARLEDVVAGSELVFPHSRAGWPGARGVTALEWSAAALARC